MEKLSTIQKRENLNSVFAVDEKENGGANHKYHIIPNNKSSVIESLWELQLQSGARNEEGNIGGIIDSDLLEIVRHRLKAFQSGQFATRENACALTHIEEALMWLNRRVEDRIERNVLGSNKK